jgi:hypothetical protein
MIRIITNKTTEVSEQQPYLRDFDDRKFIEMEYMELNMTFEIECFYKSFGKSFYDDSDTDEIDNPW